MKTFLPFVSSFRSTLAASVALGALLTTSACNTNVGADGKASFGYTSLGSMSEALAAGASDGISISVSSSAKVDHATSSDPSVLSVGSLVSYPNDPSTYSVPISGVKAGSVTFTIFDSTNSEIDHITLNVADTARIALGASNGTQLLEGQTFALQATTLDGNGGTLAGSGAVQFAYSGALASGAETTLPCLGDCGVFQATSLGSGTATSSAPGTTASATFTVLPASAIDHLSFASAAVTASTAQGSTTVGYTLSSGGNTVYDGGTGLTCVSSNGAVATPQPLNTRVGGDTSGSILVNAIASGTATFTCKVGNQAASVTVTVK
jgi:hypothetical protein